MHIVFIHGFPFDGSVWQPLVAELRTIADMKNFCRFHTPTLPGFESVDEDVTDTVNGSFLENGKKRHPMKMFLDDYVDCLYNQFPLFGIPPSERVFFCGLSMGGYVLMQWFKRYPQHLHGAIFCNTKTEADTPEVVANRLSLAESLHSRGTAALEELADSMLPKLFAPMTRTQQPDVVAALRRTIVTRSPQGIAMAALAMAEREDTTPLLAKCSFPTLVIGGEHDVFTPPETMQALGNRLSNSTTVIIPGTGHLPMLENPAATAKSLAEFVLTLRY